MLAAIDTAELLVIGPSNPIVSIGPILALPGIERARSQAADAPVVAVSPIVAGRALKGPADRMLASLGHESSALGVARLYAGLADRFVVDEADAALAPRDRGADGYGGRRVTADRHARRRRSAPALAAALIGAG